jgi:cation diffusion facilitator family transporter
MEATARQVSERSLAASRDTGESKRTAIIALTANALIAVAKLFAGLVSGSAAMFAEAAHSLADTTNQSFLLISIALSGRPPTESRPFGHGRERFLWTFMAAVGMFVAGAVFAIGWGIFELLRPPSGDTEVLIPFVVLGLSFLAEGTSWLRALRQNRHEAREARIAPLDYARGSRDPNVKMVLFEDSGALIGVAIAAAGLGAKAITGSEFWDPLASVLIGMLLVVIAVYMARDAKHFLVGSSARPEERRKLELAIEDFPEVREVRELLTMILGPKALLVAARLDLEDGIDSSRVESLSSEIDRRLQEVVPDVTEVFLDPTPSRGRRLAE